MSVFVVILFSNVVL